MRLKLHHYLVLSFILCHFSYPLLADVKSQIRALSSESLCSFSTIGKFLKNEAFLACRDLGAQDAMLLTMHQEEGVAFHLIQRVGARVEERMVTGWGDSPLALKVSGADRTSQNSLLWVEELSRDLKKDTSRQWLVFMRARAEHDVAWINAWIFDTQQKLIPLKFYRKNKSYDFLSHNPEGESTWNSSSSLLSVSIGKAKKAWRFDRLKRSFVEVK
ncbi:MAG: hypothetical protein R3A80_01850 [Bdellovibrionota bacterium]